MRSLMQHQKDALEFGKDRDTVGFNHDMRLRKCCTSIRWVQAKGVLKSGRVLLVCPKSVLPTWCHELDLEGETYRVCEGRSDTNTLPLGWNLANYESLMLSGNVKDNGKPLAVPSPLAEQCWDTVILDESPVIRKPDSQISQVCCSVFQDVSYRCILTGLIDPKSSLDLFQQMKFLLGSFMGCTNFWAFRDKYYQADAMGWAWAPRPGVSKLIADELSKWVHTCTRKDIGYVKNEEVTVIKVPLPPRIRRIYDKAEREFEVGNQVTNFKIVVRSWLAAMCGGCHGEDIKLHHSAKLDVVRELLGGELEGKQVLIWFRYKAEIRAVRKLCKELGIATARIVGQMSTFDRALNAKRFRLGKAQVMLCQVRAAKFGLDFSFCNYNIYVSLSDDPEDFYQSWERSVSIVKKDKIHYYIILAKDTVDEDKYSALRESRQRSKDFWALANANFLKRIQHGKR